METLTSICRMGIQERVPKKQSLNLLEALGAWIQGQLREIFDYAVSVNRSPGNGDQHQVNFPQSSVHQNPGFPTRSQQIAERWQDDIKMPDELHCVADKTGNPESFLFEEPASVILEDSSRTLLLLGYMESQIGETAYQHKGTIDGVVCTGARDCGGTIGVSLLRQHNHTLLCQEIRGHNLPGTTGINRKDMDSLLIDQHLPTSHICAIGDILSTEPSIWAPRLLPLCIIPEQEAETILQLVPGQQSAYSEPSDSQMDQVRQSVLMPTLESDSPGSSEGPPRASQNETSVYNVEIRNLVPRPDVSISITATASSRNNFSSRSKKRKVAALGKQALELYGLEDQRRFLETQGLGT
ncbi:hypothetical protein AYI69_g1406 [Smittium culicis]|uniref:Uncharacterized protein n=1 Tax=Smittium culicis TaxID=133412 RepID=A0A1R1YQC2_9FUNG|nr:hypothetical protein AYI69_g1406 [Smittium culicis]